MNRTMAGNATTVVSRKNRTQPIFSDNTPPEEATTVRPSKAGKQSVLSRRKSGQAQTGKISYQRGPGHSTRNVFGSNTQSKVAHPVSAYSLQDKNRFPADCRNKESASGEFRTWSSRNRLIEPLPQSRKIRTLWKRPRSQGERIPAIYRAALTSLPPSPRPACIRRWRSE